MVNTTNEVKRLIRYDSQRSNFFNISKTFAIHMKKSNIPIEVDKGHEPSAHKIQITLFM